MLQTVYRRWIYVMEHEMKISPLVVRRLRTARGWSQEQLAIASGLSLRTVQRVEAHGIASLDTAVSLAATYQVQLNELQEQSPPVSDPPRIRYSGLFLGVGVATLALISESVRLPSPFSDGFAAINALAALIGAFLAAPSLVNIVRHRKYVGGALAVLGTFLVTLLAAGVAFGVATGRAPGWGLVGMGAAGAMLAVMAARELRPGVSGPGFSRGGSGSSA
jgi:transcriptional regulator with XRE-family HTH domain